MTYNKKQMQPLIDKYQINPETSKLFISIVEMFDNQPNYQIWAVKMIFSKTMTMDELETIHKWVVENQSMVKNLEKHNVVSYSTKSAIAQLFKEMEGQDKINIIKHSIANFNTDQRKMLTSSILPREYSPLEGYSNNTISHWAEVFTKFNRITADRKKKFYSNCSRFRNAEDVKVAIENCLKETYTWNKEDFLAFMRNNTPDCEIVFDKGNCLIVHIPSFKSSETLCGHGRTQWCITQQESYFKQYVNSNSRSQYFLFDFSRNETDAFAHIGFTMDNGRGIYCAQTCNNVDMLNSSYTQNNESLSIKQVFKNFGVSMSTFMRLNKLVNYEWNMESILNLVKKNPSMFAIAYEKDGRIIINALNYDGFVKLIDHTLINKGNYMIDKNSKVYIFIDTNLNVNNERSIIAMLYQKDNYGTLSTRRVADPFNTDITKDGYLSSIGIASSDYINQEAIDPTVLLHKYIDEKDELAAIKLIEKEGNNFNVNYEFNMRVPVISAVNNKMYDLFEVIVNHPKFDSSVEDGFGETLLESLIYLYGSDEISASNEEETALKRMICAILKSKHYDFNSVDLNGDTAINVACEYPKMVWIVKALASNKNVDINIVNEFDSEALGNCIRNKNIEALKIIGQRPDLKVRKEDKKVASTYGINLDEYIKPTDSIFGKYGIEEEVTSRSNHSLAEAMAAAAI